MKTSDRTPLEAAPPSELHSRWKSLSLGTLDQALLVSTVRSMVAVLLLSFSCAAQISALKGDGQADDTAALESAIAETCAHGGSLVLPPPAVFYKISQTVAIPCGGLHIIGTGFSAGRQFDQFFFPPMVSIKMVNREPEPIFSPPSYTTFENLDIEGYNQAVLVRSAVNVSFRNVCMSVLGTTGLDDNTPLKITNSFWIWFKGGCLMANGSTTTPILIMSGEQPEHGEAPLDGLITIEDVTGAGGGMKYIQRVGQWGTAGNLVFRNITIEDLQTDILSMTSENGARYGEFENITFDHVNTSDGTPVAVISTHDPSLIIKGLFINQSRGGGSGKVRGQVSGFFDTAGVFDSMTGNSLSVGTLKFGTTQLGLSSTGVLSEFVPLFKPPANVQAAIAMDPLDPLELRQLPGTLIGTHTYVVVAVDGNRAAHYSEFAFSAPVSLRRSGSATITWTPSPSNPAGYFVVRDESLQAFYVPGATAHTYTDTGTGGGCCWERANTPSLIAKPLATQ